MRPFIVSPPKFQEVSCWIVFDIRPYDDGTTAGTEALTISLLLRIHRHLPTLTNTYQHLPTPLTTYHHLILLFHDEVHRICPTFAHR
jgi:hypothetical protein